MATVGVHYVRAALNCAVRAGLKPGPLLAAADIEPGCLNAPAGRIHGDRMSALVQQVWAGLEDEFMGCTQSRCKRGVFALMARHALHYQTLGGILEQGARFYNLFTDDIQMQLNRRGPNAELEFRFAHPGHDPECFFREFWMLIWHRFSSWLVGRKIQLNQVCFTYPRPPHRGELKLLFPCQQRFERPLLKLVFSADFLELPCIRSQQDLTAFLRYSPADLITIPGDDRSYSGRIRSLLLYQQGDALECPKFEQLARQFNLSSQTLRRRLKEEGASYPAIKEAIRRDLAIEKLVSKKISVAEIARQLNFSEPRSFSRAFKQWTGHSPSAYLANRKLPDVE